MISKLILFLAGVFCFMIAIFAATIFPPASLIFGLVAGYCFLRTVFWPMADHITGGVYCPDSKDKMPRIMFDRIQAMIAGGKYDEAISELEKILAEDAFNYMAVSMASGLYVKRFMQPEKAMACIRNYLDGRGKPGNDDVDMVLMFTDICMENGKHALAVEMLEAELVRKYASADRRLLELRLESVKKIT